MKATQLTANQLRRAAAIKDQIDALSRELSKIFVASSTAGPARKKNRAMSTSVKKKIAAAQKARWAKIKRGKQALRSAQSKKKTMSAATKAKLSAKLKAVWAAKKARKK